MRMVMCSKLKKELEGLDRPTYPGKLGENISKYIKRSLGIMDKTHDYAH